MKYSWRKVLFICVFLSLFILLVILNRAVEKEIEEDPLPVALTADKVSTLSKEFDKKDKGEDGLIKTEAEVIRRSRVERGSDYIENIFYRGDQEIARQKVYGNGKMEQTGEIPNGKVKFYDEYGGSSGEEFYLDGRKSGTAKSYHANGQLESVSTYLNDKLQTLKEYYSNGTLIFEVDYRDARLGMENEKEVGIGKLYYSDGTLKYEWHFTNSGLAYRKSYNSDESLRAEYYYDRYGKLIKKDDVTR